MKAALFDTVGRPLRIDEVADPEPAADEVLLRVSACGICGSDLHMTEDATFGLKGGEIIGHEFAGEIVSIGSDVTGFAIGDRVAVAPMRGSRTTLIATARWSDGSKARKTAPMPPRPSTPCTT